jgi:hypothetical protein
MVISIGNVMSNLRKFLVRNAFPDGEEPFFNFPLHINIPDSKVRIGIRAFQGGGVVMCPIYPRPGSN